jgi:hypothetical protein
MDPAHWQVLKGALLALALASVTCGVSAAIAVWFIIQIPATYLKDDTSAQSSIQHPVLRWTAKVLKNALGIVLIVVGVVMLITPGQGVLTIAIGILLVDFPGKRKLVRTIFRRPRVRKTVNNLRARFSKPPLEIDKRQRARIGD